MNNTFSYQIYLLQLAFDRLNKVFNGFTVEW